MMSGLKPGLAPGERLNGYRDADDLRKARRASRAISAHGELPWWKRWWYWLVSLW